MKSNVMTSSKWTQTETKWWRPVWHQLVCGRNTVCPFSVLLPFCPSSFELPWQLKNNVRMFIRFIAFSKLFLLLGLLFVEFLLLCKHCELIDASCVKKFLLRTYSSNPRNLVSWIFLCFPKQIKFVHGQHSVILSQETIHLHTVYSYLILITLGMWTQLLFVKFIRTTFQHKLYFEKYILIKTQNAVRWPPHPEVLFVTQHRYI